MSTAPDFHSALATLKEAGCPDNLVHFIKTAHQKVLTAHDDEITALQWQITAAKEEEHEKMQAMLLKMVPDAVFSLVGKNTSALALINDKLNTLIDHLAVVKKCKHSSSESSVSADEDEVAGEDEVAPPAASSAPASSAPASSTPVASAPTASLAAVNGTAASAPQRRKRGGRAENEGDVFLTRGSASRTCRLVPLLIDEARAAAIVKVPGKSHYVKMNICRVCAKKGNIQLLERQNSSVHVRVHHPRDDDPLATSDEVRVLLGMEVKRVKTS